MINYGCCNNGFGIGCFQEPCQYQRGFKNFDQIGNCAFDPHKHKFFEVIEKDIVVDGDHVHRVEKIEVREEDAGRPFCGQGYHAHYFKKNEVIDESLCGGCYGPGYGACCLGRVNEGCCRPPYYPFGAPYKNSRCA